MFYEINKIIAQIAAMKVIDRDAPAVVENFESYQEHKRMQHVAPPETQRPARHIQFKPS
jgi:hypothetical protein